MKHTDFYALYKKLDEQARKELAAAVQAHGDEYIFIHSDDDGNYDVEEKNNAPIISASTKWMESYEDVYVSKVTLEEGKFLTIYGFPKECWVDDEQELTNIAHGHLEYIIDQIPETDEVQDVTIP